MDTLCPVHGNALYRKAAIISAAIIAAGVICYKLLFAPVHIAVINATLSQQADIALNNNSSNIRLTFLSQEEAEKALDKDAIVLFGRGLYLTEEQIAKFNEGATRGTRIFTNTLNQGHLAINHNISEE